MKKQPHLSSKVLYSEVVNNIRISVYYKINHETGHIGINTRFSEVISYSSKKLFSIIENGAEIQIMCRANKKVGTFGIHTYFRKQSNYGMEGNKLCASYLGVHIAERLLKHIYKNVEQMPYGNPGYDFICGKGYKVDVKSSCLRTNWNGNWIFHIFKNTIADYFIFVAFDNRNDLNIEHVWIVPGYIVNDKTGISISKSNIDNWKQYEQSIDQFMTCCNIMKGE